MGALRADPDLHRTLGVIGGDPSVQRKVAIDYTVAAVQAFSTLGAANGRPFRFVFTSGILAVRDQNKHVWLYSDARKIKGEGENKALECAEKDKAALDTYVTRPASVLKKSGPLTGL